MCSDDDTRETTLIGLTPQIMYLPICCQFGANIQDQSESVIYTFQTYTIILKLQKIYNKPSEITNQKDDSDCNKQ